MKKEYIWTRDFQSHREAEIAIAEAFEDYNHRGIHSSLGYLTPSEYLDAWKQGNVILEEAKVSS